MNNKTAYCDLELLDSTFNNKRLYKCKYCNLTVALEDPETKIMCFKKIEDIAHKIHQNHTGNFDLKAPIHLNGKQDISDVLLEEIKKDAIKQVENPKEVPGKMCSEEEIEERLSICNTCEYFKENSCLLCGCTVIREANYKNKLAYKNQKCPADKWGPIITSETY
jgi:hypothetical protein